MVLDSQPRSASVMTLEPSQFAVLSRADFKAFLLRHAEVALQLIQNLIRVARGLNQNVRSLAMLDVYGRVARILLELAVEQGRQAGDPGEADAEGHRRARRRLARDDQPHPARPHHRRLRQLEGGRITINKAPPARW